jgi:atypical dual specificity phosphatase
MLYINPTDKARTKQVNEILPHLYLTSVFGATRENIQSKNIRVLINSALELPKAEYDGIHSLKLELHDRREEIIHIHFDWVADLIHQNVINSRAVMVHCVMGISRSTSLILAYLMKYQRMTLKDAIIHVRSRRAIIRPNSGFMKQLINYEQTLKYNAYYNYSPNSNKNTVTNNSNNNTYYYDNLNNNNNTNSSFLSYNNTSSYLNKENGYNYNSNPNNYKHDSTINSQTNNFYTVTNTSEGYKPSLSSPSLSTSSLYSSSQSFNYSYDSNNILTTSQSYTNVPNAFSSPPSMHPNHSIYKPYVEVSSSELPDWYRNKEYIQTSN